MKLRTPLHLAVGVVSLSQCSTIHAQINPLVQINPASVLGVNYNISYDGGANVGYEFTANTALTIRALGVYDYTGSAGLNASELIGLYNSSGTLLTSATVAAGTSAPLVDGFRWINITPYTLTAGQSYVADIAQDGSDPWIYSEAGSGVTLFSPSISGVPIAGPDSFSRYTYSGAGLHFPTGYFGYETYLGPNISTGAYVNSSVPDGSLTALLLGMSFTGLGCIRRKLC